MLTVSQNMPKTNELSQFERDLLESVRQAQSGEHTHMHTPAEIQARHRGRPYCAESVSWPAGPRCARG